MEKEALVSIKCLVYNHELYLRECLNGFVMQKTSFKFEVIVHDDASTDGSADIIKEYAEKYPNIIKPIYEKENQYSKQDGSLSKIINDINCGKYIALCEGDDYWIDPLKLQKQVDFLENHEDYGLIYTDVNVFLQEKNIFKRNYISSGELKRSYSFLDHLKNTGYIAPCTWLFRSELSNSIKKGCIDGTFALALDIWANSKIYYLPQVTAVYRILEESASHTKSLQNKYLRNNGVFQIQKDFMIKYPNLVTKRSENEILKKGYKKILPFAIILEKKEFIESAQLFFINDRNYIFYLILKIRKILCLKFIFTLLYKIRKTFRKYLLK
ncbi:MAG: glycosyltransferase [Bacteroidales bacterium]